MAVAVGLDTQWILPPGGAGTELTRFAHRAVETGIPHLGVPDHVSFRDGTGFDGLINAMALLSAGPGIDVHVGVYLLALRHPVPVARQLASIAHLAPGRLTLGVGIGGEDRNEYRVCGVDPTTRGRRTDEAIDVLRLLLGSIDDDDGEVGEGEHPARVDHHGSHFHLDHAAIRPRPAEPIPIVIGGRSDAALERAARAGDGWHAIWVSAGRFTEATALVAERAADLGRRPPDRHELSVWCGFDGDDGDGAGRRRARNRMEQLYGLPFDRFERYVATGGPADVARLLEPYVSAGCSTFTLVVPDLAADAAVDAAAEVGRLLR